MTKIDPAYQYAFTDDVRELFVTTTAMMKRNNETKASGATGSHF